jgi:hypothetical protein
MYIENLGIPLEKLGQETFKGLVIDCRIWIEKIKVNVDETLLGCV